MFCSLLPKHTTYPQLFPPCSKSLDWISTEQDLASSFKNQQIRNGFKLFSDTNKSSRWHCGVNVAVGCADL